jgi:hypothetical protein
MKTEKVSLSIFLGEFKDFIEENQDKPEFKSFIEKNKGHDGFNITLRATDTKPIPPYLQLGEIRRVEKEKPAPIRRIQGLEA